MRIEVRKYGDLLVSRPSGREAAAAMLSHLPEPAAGENVVLDFEGVLVVAPSWLDEVLTALRARYGDRARCLATQNASLEASLATLGETAVESG